MIEHNWKHWLHCVSKALIEIVSQVKSSGESDLASWPERLLRSQSEIKNFHQSSL